MAFPSHFLDELRARLPVSRVVGRKVRLVRRGDEHTGLCPFHNEKTPSFTVNDRKGFYHCFGCGAHGDIISFQMETTHLSFLEVIEILAAEAGLEVPQPDPQRREETRRRSGILEVIEAACSVFQQQLFSPAGARGYTYLRQRGLDDATIKTFRLGWAAEAGTLKSALSPHISEAQLIEAGLLKRSETGTVADYFRNRIIFPITDRQKRVIAFGGRTLGDRQPKYINSPETPVFHKGHVLYNLALAHSEKATGYSVIVAEGYMDVIAFARAGGVRPVAPLGTALTESQIEELWKLDDEPVLCMDGDTAGRRAVTRALFRALPLLRPGKSLGVVFLPQGHDPDDILSQRGPQVLRELVSRPRPLSDVLWEHALQGRSLDTPERRAALGQQLDEWVSTIQDRNVRQHYHRTFRQKQWDLFRTPTPSAQRKGSIRRSDGFGVRVHPAGSFGTNEKRHREPGAPSPQIHSTILARYRILLATVIHHPGVFDRVGERLGCMDFPDPYLDRLRGAIVHLLSVQPNLDSEGLVSQLKAKGFDQDVDSLLTPELAVHAAFSRPGATMEDALSGWEHVFELLGRRDLEAEVRRAAQRLGREWTPETLGTLSALKKQADCMVDD